MNWFLQSLLSTTQNVSTILTNVRCPFWCLYFVLSTWELHWRAFDIFRIHSNINDVIHNYRNKKPHPVFFFIFTFTHIIVLSFVLLIIVSIVHPLLFYCSPIFVILFIPSLLFPLLTTPLTLLFYCSPPPVALCFNY